MTTIPPSEPHHDIAELLRLVDDLRRLAHDRNSTTPTGHAASATGSANTTADWTTTREGPCEPRTDP